MSNLTNSTSAILNNVSKHIVLDERETAFFLSFLKEKKVKKNEVFLSAGEPCYHINFIVKGCLRIYTEDDNGFEHIAVFPTEGWWASDLPAFLTQTAATYNIESLEETLLMQIQKSDLEKLYLEVPKFERYFRILHQNAFINQLQRSTQTNTITAQQRYLNFTKKYPSLEQRISQKYIAAYLGMTPEHLSRLKSKLAKGAKSE